MDVVSRARLLMTLPLPLPLSLVVKVGVEGAGGSPVVELMILGLWQFCPT